MPLKSGLPFAKRGAGAFTSTLALRDCAWAGAPAITTSAETAATIDDIVLMVGLLFAVAPRLYARVSFFTSQSFRTREALMFDTVWQDVRYGWRSLSRTPAF